MADHPRAPRPSGGKRAGDKRRAERAEKEAGSDPKAERAVGAFLRKTGKPPKDTRQAPDWLMRSQIELARMALRNQAIPLSQRIEQAGRRLEAAGRSVDAAKLRVELDELLELLNKGAPADGAQEHGGKGRGGETPARH